MDEFDQFMILSKHALEVDEIWNDYQNLLRRDDPLHAEARAYFKEQQQLLLNKYVEADKKIQEQLRKFCETMPHLNIG